MEKPALYILGQAKEINDVQSEQSIPLFLRDPFSATLNDFMVYCLNELSEALHLTIVHTYYQLPPKKRTHFYLVGYKERTGWQSLQQKIYDDPSLCDQGLEIKWLLKNLRWYWRKYAEYMELFDDAFDDITGFLLFDVVQSAYRDCSTELNDVIDEYLVQDCFEAALDLVIAVTEAKFYEPIAEDVLKHKENLEKLLPFVSEFQTYQTKRRDAQEEGLDTNKVLEFLKSEIFLQALEKEKSKPDNNPVEKPLTNYFLYTVMPRFENLATVNDSGIESGACTNINEPTDPVIIPEPVIIPDHVIIPEPVDILPTDLTISQTYEKDLLDSVIDRLEDSIQIDATDSILVDANDHVLIDDDDDDDSDESDQQSSSSDPLVNTTMDGSIVVINRHESTPKQTTKNTTLERLKKEAASFVIPEEDDDDNDDDDDDSNSSADDVNQSDQCDGSFVLI